MQLWRVGTRTGRQIPLNIRKSSTKKQLLVIFLKCWNRNKYVLKYLINLKPSVFQGQAMWLASTPLLIQINTLQLHCSNNNYSQHSLQTRLSSKYIMHIDSFNPHNNPVITIQLLYPFHRGAERLTCLKSPREQVAERGVKPRHSISNAHTLKAHWV